MLLISGKVYRDLDTVAIRIDSGYLPSEIVIEDCYFENVHGGVYAYKYSGKVTVRKCTFVNMTGGKQPGGGTFSRGQAFQINQCNATSLFEDNLIINRKGENYSEDHVNCHRSTGATMIRNNRIIGSGSTTSGAGILLGDRGGSNQRAVNNILVDCNQVGIGIAGGSLMQARSNKLWNDNKDGLSNVGIYSWGNNHVPDPNPCTIEDNEVYWISNQTKKQNRIWVPDKKGTVLNNRTLIERPDTSKWQEEARNHKQRLLGEPILPLEIPVNSSVHERVSVLEKTVARLVHVLDSFQIILNK